MDNKKSNIEKLVVASIENKKLTKEELLRVQDWIRASGEHQSLYEEMDRINLAAHCIIMDEKVNPDKALQKVLHHIHRRKIFIPSFLYPIAAILIIAFGLGIFYRLKSPVQTIEYITLKTQKGEKCNVVLPDSSIVYLNSETSLRYPVTFQIKKDRLVTLDGEAYFEITKKAKSHFIVQTSHKINIKVLGTKFNVKAHASEDDVSTVLIQGEVQLEKKWDNRVSCFSMKPGDKIVYHANTNTMTYSHSTGEVETCWKEGHLIFQNTPLKEVIDMLEKQYGVSIQLLSPNRKDSFTGTFKGATLDQILEYLRLSSGIHSHYQMNTDSTQQVLVIY